MDVAGIPPKRMKRHLREIKDLVNSLLVDSHKNLPQCIEAESFVTVEGLRRVVQQLTEEVSNYKKENEVLKQYAKVAEELPALQKANVGLTMTNKILEEEKQILEENLLKQLGESSEKAAGFERQNQELAAKVNRYETEMKIKMKQIESQRQADANLLGRYMEEIEKQKNLNTELKMLVKESKQNELKMAAQLSEMHLKMESERQNSGAYISQSEKNGELTRKELTDIIETLRKQYSDLLAIKEEGIAEREFHHSTTAAYNKLKGEQLSVEAAEEKVVELEGRLRESERWKVEVEEKRRQLESLSIRVKEIELEGRSREEALEAWIQLTKRHVQEEEATPEALERHLFSRFTEIQILTHHKTTAERRNDDMNLSMSRYEEEFKRAEATMSELNHRIANFELQLKSKEEEKRLLEQKIEAIKIEIKGEKLPDELMDKKLSEVDDKYTTEEMKLERDAVKAELENAKKYFKVLQHERDRLQAISFEYQTVKYEANRLVTEKELLEKQNNELQSSVKKLKDQLTLNKRDMVNGSERTMIFGSQEDDFDMMRNEEIAQLKGELDATSKQKDELFSKCKAIKEYYKRETTMYRETILGLLGWNVRSEIAENGVRYRLSSLYSTHDGEFVFYPKESDPMEEKYSIPEYSLYFDGYYITKWTRDNVWRNKLKLSNSFPSFLAATCLEELESIRSQFRGRIPKNSFGMLLPSIGLPA